MEQGIVMKEYESSKGVVPLSYLTSTLGRWEIILPALYRLIEKVKSQDTPLLDILLDQVRSGIPEVHYAIQKMIKDLNHVFYRQCTTWMIYGRLPSHSNDFFIIEQKYNQEENDEQIIIQHTEWQRKYQLVNHRIPKHISLSLAESILYIGKAIATTNNNMLCMPIEMKKKHISLLQSLLKQQSSDIGSNDKEEGNDTYPLHFIFNSFEKVVQEIKKSTTEWLFSQVFYGDHRLSRYFISFRHIFLLKDGELAIKWLELLSTTRSNNNDDVNYKNTKENQGLLSSSRKKRTTIDYEENNDLEGQDGGSLLIFNSLKKKEWLALFVKASYGTDSEDKLDGFNFELSTLSARSPLQSFLGGTLIYQLSWPIDLFLSDQDIRCYSSLWSLLMGLKRIQLSLHRLFNSTSETTVIIEDETNDDDQDDIQEDEDLERAIWRLRSFMIFWIDTLWNHLQGSVITNHFEELMSTTSCSQIDFEKIQIAHQQFLIELVRGCFLTKYIKNPEETKYIHLLNTVLQVCLSFCNFVKEKEKNEIARKKRKMKRKSGRELSLSRSVNPISVSVVSRIVNDYQRSKRVIDWINQLIELENAFVLSSERLFGYLSNLQQDIKASGYISELLMKLDYNKWYSVVKYKSIPEVDEEVDEE
ncbi:unnamed protein product [Cunninghamella blakesleeana]